ncbi:MAG: hypothetical protein ACRDZ4_11210 [Egibacteraceae bacterium]
MAAVTQVRNDTPGRAYYQRKVPEHKSKKDTLRALKRRVNDAVYRQLTLDAKNPSQRGREDNQGRLNSCVAGLAP